MCASLCFRAKHALISAYITLVRINHSCPQRSLRPHRMNHQCFFHLAVIFGNMKPAYPSILEILNLLSVIFGNIKPAIPQVCTTPYRRRTATLTTMIGFHSTVWWFWKMEQSNCITTTWCLTTFLGGVTPATFSVVVRRGFICLVPHFSAAATNSTVVG